MAALAGVGWFLMQPSSERAGVPCRLVSRLAEWVKASGVQRGEWDGKVRRWVEAVEARCPAVIQQHVSPLADQARQTARTTLHAGLGTATQAAKERQIVAALDGRTLRIGGLGPARLLGVTVPSEKEDAARAYLHEHCVEPKRLVVEIFKEKDAEGYPLVVVYEAHDRMEPLRSELSVNQRLIAHGLAVPWRLELPEAPWTRVRPAHQS
jgi:endonuclease YncB( thermonuclease family)